MQQIFEVDVSPRDYARQGMNFNFPTPNACPNPECLIPIPPKKHGFYERNSLGFCYRGKIIIRRYYCPCCGKTISYLPSFCLPYFQYTLAVIFQVLVEHLIAAMSYNRIIQKFKRKHNKLHLQTQHIAFYILRLLMNLNAIQIGLRQLKPDISLPEFGLDIKKGAKKILHIVKYGFQETHTFSGMFFKQCNRSFLSPLQIILA